MNYKDFIARLFVYLKPHIGKLIFTSVIMMLASALEASIPEITGRIVDSLFVERQDKQTALMYALALFAVIAISSIFTLSSVASSSWVSSKVIMDLRTTMFAKLLVLPKTYFDQHPSGRILSKLTFDVGQIAASASTIWLEFIKSLMIVAILISYLFYKNWQLSITLIMLLPLVYWIVKLSAKRMRNASKNVQQSMGGMTSLLSENIVGNSLIKIYHAQSQEGKKFSNLVKHIRQQSFKVDMTAASNSAVVNILIGISLASVVYFSATSLKMSAGEFLSFFTAMGMLIKPAKTLININKPLQMAMAAGESVFGLIDEATEPNTGSKKIAKSAGSIEFKGLSFGYTSGANILNQINLTIKPAETVAFVGATGSGKTTIIQLLMRFYKPCSGTISIDGVDISTFDIDALRTQISFVDQNVRLFSDTVTGNIALGQLSSMPFEQVKHAAKVANATEFIEKMPKQFDTEIGENGNKLSGGQRQRLAIARAVAKDSPILILDEATSALDSATEKQVQVAIDAMQKDRTTLIIAHRLSTVKKADRIVVLKSGRIIEQGSHKDLLAKGGEYATLYAHQFED